MQKIVEFIKRKVKEARASGAVLGISGGLDSAVTAYLCAEALGKEKVLGLILPEDHQDISDACLVIDSLGIKSKTISITPIVSLIAKGDEDKVTFGNLKARVRMILLYYYANRENRLVVGTGNKSELTVGYFTKYGDGACDLLPLGNMYKTDVLKLAKELRVPKKIIEKTPSAELWPGQTDEQELGLSYEELDEILKNRKDSKSPKAKLVLDRIRNTEHKRRIPETP